MIAREDGGYDSASDYDEATLALIAHEEQAANECEEDVQCMAADDADRYASLIVQRVLSVQVIKAEQDNPIIFSTQREL